MCLGRPPVPDSVRLLFDGFLNWHRLVSWSLTGGNSSISRKGQQAFFNTMDPERELAQGATRCLPLFIDVGGVMSSQRIVFRQRHPALAGRAVLNITCKLRAGQNPSKLGTRAHYLRNVLHDWPDAKATKILTTIETGMTEESVILVNEAGPTTRGAQ
ncbi:hypothetical protein DL764_003529 [Monosporascus ibericus]|uniref:O-methyltransferase domain-containing protein n=1 Tax=Monosporascus ibericus TaxID=155417 RepID=A0A4Q4TG69_9PEZI|nr:hypothetical protein DL764_003529 [Monosporascus ibericus]